MSKRLKYPPYIDVVLLEHLVDDTFPERKGEGTDKDWLVRLSWLVGNVYFKNKYRHDFDKKDGRVSYGFVKSYFTKQTSLVDYSKLFPIHRDGSKTKRYTIPNWLHTKQPDSIDKILSLVFRCEYVGHSGVNSRYFIRESIKDLLQVASYKHKEPPTEPDTVLPTEILLDLGKQNDLRRKEIQINDHNLMDCLFSIEVYLHHYTSGKHTVKPIDFLRDQLKSGVHTLSEEQTVNKIREYKTTLEHLRLLKSHPKGWRFYQHYKVASSGRIVFNKVGEINFQTMSKPTREIIFGGLGYYDVDINNCHPTILSQYYTMLFGKEHRELNEYKDNYRQIRNQIHTELDIDYNLGKQIILSLLYSGQSIPTTEKQVYHYISNEYEIVKHIKKYYTDKQNVIDVLIRLTKNKTILHLRNVFSEVRNEIKKRGGYNIRMTKSGMMSINPNGNRVLETEKSGGGLLGHLLQGIETQIMYSVIRRYLNDIVCLYYDGFILDHEPENLHVLTETVKKDTEYTMSMWNNKYKVGLTRVSGFDVDFTHQLIPNKTIEYPIQKPRVTIAKPT